jgi:release factor glutamine methyltransferase
MSIIPVSAWLRASQTVLTEARITTARLDALVLLADELGKDKSWILAHPEFILDTGRIEKLNTKIDQRVQHTPLAYIRGHVEFYGRDFIVNEHVLVPRPESESMIELLKGAVAHDVLHLEDRQKMQREHPQLTIIDVGTGSGCLGITAKLELPCVEVITTDISGRALQVATTNAKKLGAPITSVKADLLAPVLAISPVKQPVVILANLPYVPAGYPINEAAKHEPRIALFSDNDGLRHYERLFTEVDKLTTQPICIITESLPEQHILLSAIAKKSGYYCCQADGLVQCFLITLPDRK